MTIAVALSILALAWLALCIFGHGYANTVQWVAWKLHRHAKRISAMQARRTELMQER